MTPLFLYFCEDSCYLNRSAGILLRYWRNKPISKFFTAKFVEPTIALHPLPKLTSSPIYILIFGLNI